MTVRYKALCKARLYNTRMTVYVQSMMDTLLDMYPCLHAHKEYADDYWTTANLVFWYVDFPGNNVAAGKCIADYRELECFVEVTYETIAYIEDIDYSTDSLVGGVTHYFFFRTVPIAFV